LKNEKKLVVLNVVAVVHPMVCQSVSSIQS